MLRPAPAVLAAALLVACGGTPTPPPPTEVVDASQLPLVPPRTPPTAASPFHHPDKEPPPARSEPQIPAAELDAALAAAAAARAAGDTLEVTRLLFPCANKIPKHIQCEGELAIALAGYAPRKAEARYYLEHAVADDDPTADADFYARLAAAMLKMPMWPEAAVALQRRIARLPEPTAADHVALAAVLQGIPKRTSEAAAALQRAFELDPGQLDHLRDAGILLSQLPERRAEALAMLTRYRDAVRTTEPEKLSTVQAQIEQLEAESAAPPPAQQKQPRVKKTSRSD